MLAQRVERIRDGIFEQGKDAGKREGKLEGKLEGKREGKLEGERSLFLKLYAFKNGGRVSKDVRERASKAKLRQLETWAERLLTVKRAEDVFND